MTSTLLSINNYHYRRGGAEVVFFRHNAIFEQAGWDVVPFSMRHEENVPSRWGNYFVEEIELGRATDNLLTRARKGLKAVYSLEARSKLAELIARVKPSICHAHNVYHHLSPSILSLVRARRIPLVMTLHDLKIAVEDTNAAHHERTGLRRLHRRRRRPARRHPAPTRCRLLQRARLLGSHRGGGAGLAKSGVGQGGGAGARQRSGSAPGAVVGGFRRGVAPGGVGHLLVKCLRAASRPLVLEAGGRGPVRTVAYAALLDALPAHRADRGLGTQTH